MSRLNQLLQWISLAGLTLLFVGAGLNHFVRPEFYLKIMPPILPWPMALIYISGFFEILGGLGILIARSRSLFGWGLIALLIAVLPANIQMAVNADHFPNVPAWAIMLRLPLQIVIIGWVYWTTIRSRTLPVRPWHDLPRE